MYFPLAIQLLVTGIISGMLSWGFKAIIWFLNYNDLASKSATPEIIILLLNFAFGAISVLVIFFGSALATEHFLPQLEVIAGAILIGGLFYLRLFLWGHIPPLAPEEQDGCFVIGITGLLMAWGFAIFCGGLVAWTATFIS